MNKRKIAILLAAVLCFPGTAACAKKTDPGHVKIPGMKKVTAEDILVKIQDKMEAAGSVSALLGMNLSASYEADGVSADLDVIGSYAYEFTGDSSDYHIYGSTSVNLTDTSVENEYYLIHDGGRETYYQRENDTWTTGTPEDGTDSGMSLTDLITAFCENGYECAASAEGETIGITGELPVSELCMFAKDTLGMFGNAPEDAHAEITVLTDADGNMTLFQADISGTYAEEMTAEMNKLGYGEVSADHLILTVSNLTFDSLSNITVPSAVVAAALPADGSGAADESETGASVHSSEGETEALQETISPETDEAGYVTVSNPGDMSALLVKIPEGYSAVSLDGNGLACVKDGSDGEVSVTYMVYAQTESVHEEEVVSQTDALYNAMSGSADYSEVTLEELGEKTAAGKTFTCRKLSWLQYTVVYGAEYDAVTVLSDGRLVRISVKENSFVKPVSMLDYEAEIENLADALE